jgi:hypothetical protein
MALLEFVRKGGEHFLRELLQFTVAPHGVRGQGALWSERTETGRTAGITASASGRTRVDTLEVLRQGIYYPSVPEPRKASERWPSRRKPISTSPRP